MSRNNNDVTGDHGLRFDPLPLGLEVFLPVPSRVIARVLAVVVAVWIGAGVAEATAPQPVGGPSGKQWILVPTYSDEFNGPTFDNSKWYLTYSWIDSGSVQPIGDSLQLTVYENLGAIFVVSSTLGKSPFGYYEARIKSANLRMDSAFFLHSYETPSTPHREIDIVEQFGTWSPNTAYFNAYYWVGNQPVGNQNLYDTGQNLTADYHVYGLDWNPGTLDWYVDGVMRASIANTHWQTPMEVWLSLFSAEWLGAPESLPATSQVDYVRAWQEVPEPGTMVLFIIAGLFLDGGAWHRRR